VGVEAIYGPGRYSSQARLGVTCSLTLLYWYGLGVGLGSRGLLLGAGICHSGVLLICVKVGVGVGIVCIIVYRLSRGMPLHSALLG
jgi:hypothetical protein